MLDIAFIRENVSLVRKNMANRKLDGEKLDALLAVDKERVALIQKRDEVNARRNDIAKQMAKERSNELIEEGKALKGQSEAIEKELTAKEQEFHELMLWIPNMMSAEVPIGKGEEDNVEIVAWVPSEGYLSKEKLGKAEYSGKFMPTTPPHASGEAFSPKDHITLGEMHDIIDVKQSALVSGSRFAYVKNAGVLLQMAMVDMLTRKLITEGFFPINPPLLVKERALMGTSHFPADRDQVYAIKNENVEQANELFLVGSSEPSNFAYFMDKTLPEETFPQKMFATTACFRSEVGSWGKDVRGIKRVHQFEKLEMDVVCLPSQAEDIFQQLLSINQWFWEALEIPYHIILKCTGDSGYYASAKQCDIEAWLPSQKAFMEVGTDTNASDFQARRMNIKYRTKEGKTFYAATVNDTGCPLGRALIAIIDNYQQKDRSIKIPSALQDYVGFDTIRSGRT